MSVGKTGTTSYMAPDKPGALEHDETSSRGVDFLLKELF